MTRALTIGLFAALCAGPALAQTAAPAPTADTPLGGPLVAGVCLLSQQALFANAKVGIAAAGRLQQLSQQAQAEIDGGRAAIQTEAKALETKRATLKAADYQQQQNALAARFKALQDKAAVRSREIEVTREKALSTIADQARPVIAQVYTAHNCGLLVDRSSIIGGNMAGDLTAAVVQGLDAKITTITFDRETLPPGAGPAVR